MVFKFGNVLRPQSPRHMVISVHGWAWVAILNNEDHMLIGGGLLNR